MRESFFVVANWKGRLVAIRYTVKNTFLYNVTSCSLVDINLRSHFSTPVLCHWKLALLGHQFIWRQAGTVSARRPEQSEERSPTLKTCQCLTTLTLILLIGRIGWAPNSIPIYIQQDETLHSLFISGNCSTCFGWYFHQSTGTHTTVSTAFGICHTVTTICRCRGRVGTGLSLPWVAYATTNFNRTFTLLHCTSTLFTSPH
jgi:hypothetical protein